MRSIYSHSRFALIVILTIFPTLGGCLSTSTYVDPKARKADYGDLRRPASPIPVVLNVKFQFNGADKALGQDAARKRIVAALTRSGVFAPTLSADKPGIERLDIVVNDIGDVGKAVGAGFLTGFTFGLVGSSSTDHYIMTVKYHTSDGRDVHREYQHDIVATVGNKQPPPGLQEVALADRSIESLRTSC